MVRGNRREVSVPRRGFRSLLLWLLMMVSLWKPRVSVPRRGFRSLLPDGPHRYLWKPSRFSPPKGIQVFATWLSPVFNSYSFSFQSPEGDSGLCYLRAGLAHTACGKVSVPRRGFRSLLRTHHRSASCSPVRFSPPKGIQVFATRSPRYIEHCQRRRFQSPEGDSGLCYDEV